MHRRHPVAHARVLVLVVRVLGLLRVVAAVLHVVGHASHRRSETKGDGRLLHKGLRSHGTGNGTSTSRKTLIDLGRDRVLIIRIVGSLKLLLSSGAVASGRPANSILIGTVEVGTGHGWIVVITSRSILSNAAEAGNATTRRVPTATS